ncbi:MAG TPA: helix-turn-helix domain-containing protein [Steroidobacteraceae bacterium]|jgi:transcriptional regulator GlxA family with amidase domain
MSLLVRDAELRDVFFVVLPNLVLLDLAGPAEAFRLATRAVPDSYRLHFIGPTRNARAAIGLDLASLEPLPARLPPQAIVVISGLTGESIDFGDPDIQRVTAWLSAGVTSDAMLLCVCAGSVIAGRAGLLTGRECTTHHAHIEELRAAAPGSRVLDNRVFVEDGSVFTSAGVTAGLDLALYLISRQLGPRIGAEVARELVVYLRRAGTDPALSPWVLHRNHLHPAVHRVQDAVARLPAASWTAEELSAVACTSARNLARLFAEHARCSPLDYVQLIRVAFARELMTQTTLDLERVAARAGFRSAQQLRRVWARWERHTPSGFRAAHSPGPARARPAQSL